MLGIHPGGPLNPILVPLLAALAAAPAPATAPPSPASVDVARATMPPDVWKEMLGPALKSARDAIAAKLLEAHIAAPPAMLDEVTAVIAEAFSYDAFIDIYLHGVLAEEGASCEGQGALAEARPGGRADSDPLSSDKSA